MSNKTPPLVIPVVIDSTGVDKGLNNVNNRLRRGGGGGGVSGGGGFGSGGSAALGLAAAGGGFGAAAALSRGGGAVGGTTPMVKSRGLLPLMGVEAGFRGGGMAGPYRRALASVDQIPNMFFLERAKNASGKTFIPRVPSNEALDAAQSLIGEQRRNHLYNVRQRRGQLYSAIRTSRIRSTIGRNIPSLGDVGGALTSARGMLGAAGIGLSAGAAASGGIGFLRNMPNIADPESAIGSPFYGRLRQTTNFFAQQPKRLGLGQGIIAGANMMGGKGALNQLGANTQAGIESIGLSLGMFLEGMLTDPMNTVGSALGIKSSRNVMMKSLVNGLMN